MRKAAVFDLAALHSMHRFAGTATNPSTGCWHLVKNLEAKPTALVGALATIIRVEKLASIRTTVSGTCCSNFATPSNDTCSSSSRTPCHAHFVWLLQVTMSCICWRYVAHVLAQPCVLCLSHIRASEPDVTRHGKLNTYWQALTTLCSTLPNILRVMSHLFR